MRILITGGAGFIGHHVVDHLLKHTDWKLTLIDRLDNSGNMNRLAELNMPSSRVRFIFHDLKASINGLLAEQIGKQDCILHLAAATHVDRSIKCPMEFVMDNIVATCNILDFANQSDCHKMLYFSTDEIFGPAPEGIAYKEDDRYRSGNPYAATKAGAEELCLAFHNTYGTPVMISHCMNVFGERQHPEKFIPMTIGKVKQGQKVMVHSNANKTKSGSRFYIHAQEVAKAILFLIYHGNPGEKYNIVGEKEINNLELAMMISNIIGEPLIHEMVDFHSSRPGHDLRYALDGTKLARMGWTPTQSVEKSLRQTVEWTLLNSHWMTKSNLIDMRKRLPG